MEHFQQSPTCSRKQDYGVIGPLPLAPTCVPQVVYSQILCQCVSFKHKVRTLIVLIKFEHVSRSLEKNCETND